jgi:hypothetical protein
MNNAASTSNMQAKSDRLFSWRYFDSARQALLQLSVRVLYDAQQFVLSISSRSIMGPTPDHAVEKTNEFLVMGQQHRQVVVILGSGYWSQSSPSRLPILKSKSVPYRVSRDLGRTSA